MQDHFDHNIWESFFRSTVHGDTPKEIAADLGISAWAVYKAKNR